MILVDSSVWIDAFNGTDNAATRRLDELLGEQPLLIGDLILVEVLQGFRSQRDHDHALGLLSEFQCVDMLGREVALAAASNYRRLRRRGVAVRSTIDLIIATFCILGGHALLTSDGDFEALRSHLGLATA